MPAAVIPPDTGDPSRYPNAAGSSGRFTCSSQVGEAHHPQPDLHHEEGDHQPQGERHHALAKLIIVLAHIASVPNET